MKHKKILFFTFIFLAVFCFLILSVAKTEAANITIEQQDVINLNQLQTDVNTSQALLDKYKSDNSVPQSIKNGLQSQVDNANTVLDAHSANPVNHNDINASMLAVSSVETTLKAAETLFQNNVNGQASQSNDYSQDTKPSSEDCFADISVCYNLFGIQQNVYPLRCGDTSLDFNNVVWNEDPDWIYRDNKIGMACLQNTDTTSSAKWLCKKTNYPADEVGPCPMKCIPGVNGGDAKCLNCIVDSDCMTDAQKAASEAFDFSSYNILNSGNMVPDSSECTSDLSGVDINYTTYNCTPGGSSGDETVNKCDPTASTATKSCFPNICNASTGVCDEDLECNPSSDDATIQSVCGSIYGYLDSFSQVFPHCGSDASSIYYYSEKYNCVGDGYCNKIVDSTNESSKLCYPVPNSICKGEDGAADCVQQECGGPSDTNLSIECSKKFSPSELAPKTLVCSSDNKYVQKITDNFTCPDYKCQHALNPATNVTDCSANNQVCSQPDPTKDAKCVDAVCNPDHTFQDSNNDSFSSDCKNSIAVTHTTTCGHNTGVVGFSFDYAQDSYPGFTCPDGTCVPAGTVIEKTPCSASEVCNSNPPGCTPKNTSSTGGSTTGGGTGSGGSGGSSSGSGGGGTPPSEPVKPATGSSGTSADFCDDFCSKLGILSPPICYFLCGATSQPATGGTSGGETKCICVYGNWTPDPCTEGITQQTSTATCTPSGCANYPVKTQPCTPTSNPSPKSGTFYAACYLSSGSMGHCTGPIGSDGKCNCSN